MDANLLVAVQSGKTLSDDIAIRDELSNPALANIDMIIHHRFAYQPQGIDPRLPELQQIVESWAADTTGAGGSDPDLFVSAWNTVTLTRNDALTDYVADARADGLSIDPTTIDLDGRTDTDFEQFWQDRLAEASYGQEQAAYILESFSSYAEAGMDAGSVYGIDTVNPGHLSWREGGQDYTFVGAQMVQMIYESVGGTHVLATKESYSRHDPLTVYGFENDDKLIVFIAAGHTAPGDIVLDLDGLGSEYLNVWAERLTSETPEDWMSVFGVADNPDVDESPEALAYAVGVREAVLPDISDSGLGLTLEDAHDVIRLSFAKSAAGFAEISGWSIGDPSDLSVVPELPVADSEPTAFFPEEAEEETLGKAIADAAGSGALGMVLALLFFLV